MKDVHVSEVDIQRCAVDPSDCSESVRHHVNSCLQCRREVELYLAILSAVKDQPILANDFDIYSIAMPKVRKSANAIVPTLIMATSVLSFAFLLIALSYSMIRKANLLPAWKTTGNHELDCIFIIGALIVLMVYTVNDFQNRRERLNNIDLQ